MLPTFIKSRRRVWIALAVLLALGGLGAGTALMANRKVSDPAKTENKAKKEDDKVYEFAQRDFVTLAPRELGGEFRFSGTMKPLAYTVVKSRVTAEVRELPVREGEWVKKGQIVARLDAADAQARYDSQRATLEDAKARKMVAQKNAQAQRDLLAKNFISQNAFDNVQGSYDAADAQVKAAEAQLVLVRRQLEDTVLRAPMDGFIAKRAVQVGERVAEQQALIQIADLSRMEVEAQLPLTEAPRVKIGTEAQLEVDGLPGRSFAAKVERMAPLAEAGSRSLTLYLVLNNPDQVLKGGMFATGSVKASSSVAVASLPVNALREEGGAYHVFVFDGKTLQRRPIEVGTINRAAGLVEVKGGLNKDDRVLGIKSDVVKHGTKAVIKEQTAETKVV